MACLMIFSIGMWCNTDFMKSDPENEERRTKELFNRLEDIVNEAYDVIISADKNYKFYGKLESENFLNYFRMQAKRSSNISRNQHVKQQL